VRSHRSRDLQDAQRAKEFVEHHRGKRGIRCPISKIRPQLVPRRGGIRWQPWSVSSELRRLTGASKSIPFVILLAPRAHKASTPSPSIGEPRTLIAAMFVEKGGVYADAPGAVPYVESFLI
jgi:hypothetical protein